jgi:hypothetical protein
MQNPPVIIIKERINVRYRDQQRFALFIFFLTCEYR